MKISELKEGFLYQDLSKRGHCKNGTFFITIEDNGVRVYDTYWTRPGGFRMSDYILATEEYVENFEEVLEFDKYRMVNGYDAIKDYNECDYIQAHCSQCSGRFRGNLDFFIKKEAKKSYDIVKERLENHIENLQRRVESSMIDLKRLEDGELTPDQVFIF